MSCLLIGDQPATAQLLQQALRRQFSAIDVASDEKQGLSLGKETRYRLIVVDWLPSKVDGLTVVRRLRHQGVLAPILLLSDQATVADRVNGLQAGADDYVCRPFEMEELLARIRALLRRPWHHVPSLRVADLELDCAQRRVSRSGKRIHLSQKEFAILEYLMRNLGHPVTRDALLDHCWDGGFQGLISVIDVHINYLRRKIDRGFEKKLIHTVRGVGYMVMDPDSSPADS